MSSVDFWDANASGRAKWAHKFDESFGPMSARLVEMAGVSVGHRVLDIGTGTGEPALTAARRTGPGGAVVATDFSGSMLKRAGRRAAQQRLPVEFRVMDATDLDFPEASFDAALCQLVLMFLPDPGATLRATRRLLRPGGRLAAAVLGPLPKTPSVMIWQAALSKEREISGAALESKRPAPSNTANPFQFSDPAMLGIAMAEAGFGDVQVEVLPTSHNFDSADEFVGFQLDMDPAVKEQISIEGTGRILDEVRRSLAHFTDESGRVRLTHVHNLVSGAAP